MCCSRDIAVLEPGFDIVKDERFIEREAELREQRSAAFGVAETRDDAVEQWHSGDDDLSLVVTRVDQHAASEFGEGEDDVVTLRRPLPDILFHEATQLGAECPHRVPIKNRD